MITSEWLTRTANSGESCRVEVRENWKAGTRTECSGSFENVDLRSAREEKMRICGAELRDAQFLDFVGKNIRWKIRRAESLSYEYLVI